MHNLAIFKLQHGKYILNNIMIILIIISIIIYCYHYYYHHNNKNHNTTDNSDFHWSKITNYNLCNYNTQQLEKKFAYCTRKLLWQARTIDQENMVHILLIYHCSDIDNCEIKYNFKRDNFWNRKWIKNSFKIR